MASMGSFKSKHYSKVCYQCSESLMIQLLLPSMLIVEQLGCIFKFRFPNMIEKHYYSFFSSITTSQDAHKRLVLQIVEWLTDLLPDMS